MHTKTCFVLDLDGTVYLGDRPIAGAVAFVRAQMAQREFFFLSNNTSKAPATYVKKLAGLGIQTDLAHILSPITPLVAYLEAHAITRVYPVGNHDFQTCLRERLPKLVLSHKDAEAVILAYDTELTYAKLCHAALLLQRSEVAYLATHPDLVCPSPEGPLPDVGSFMALFETVTGRRPERIFGKPYPAVLAPALAKHHPDTMVMVGDRLATDKLLAENAGMDFILVLSGEATRADLVGLQRQPTWVVEDLGCVVMSV